jgi:hypothetical protein
LSFPVRLALTFTKPPTRWCGDLISKKRGITAFVNTRGSL